MNPKYQQALDYYNEENYDAAESILSSIKETNSNPEFLFLLAVTLSKKGNTKAAIDQYLKIVSINPNHLEAIYNLGLCYQNIGQDYNALEFYNKALQLNPFFSEAHNNLAIIYKNLNNLSQAEIHYNLALKSRPDNANIISNLANLKNSKECSAELRQVSELYEKGDLESALRLLYQLVEKHPQNIEFLNSIATLLFQSNDINAALTYFRRILEIHPESELAHYSLGVCYQNLEDNNSALNHYIKCTELNPTHLDALNNMGLLYTALKKYDEAEKCFKTAIKINPDYFNAYTNYGSLLINMDSLKEAIEYFNHALKIANLGNNIPNKSVALANLGFIKLKEKKLEEAIEFFDLALELNPESVLANYNKAETLLMAGKLDEAWPFYEFRTSRKDFGKRLFHKTPHSLKELKGKRVLVFAEQGIGDAFQFIRYIPLLKNEGCYVIFECDKTIFGLLDKFPDIDLLIERDLLNPPEIDYDFDLPLLSLPLLFKTDLDTIPADIPYLFADEQLKMKWKNIIGDEKYKIGIVWAGSPIHTNDRHRSVRLDKFMNLFSIEGTRFFSLQKGFPLIQAKDYQLLISNLDDYNIANFSDTAAILANLDLLITVDTSVAHIAGAMGVPVWILIPYNCDWRWMLDRTDTPWYPSAKLFRQPALGDWDSVFRQLKKELTKIVSQERIPSMKEKRKFSNLDSFLDKIEKQVYAEPITPVHSHLTETALNNILTKYQFNKNIRILDIGCGQGPALEIFRSNGFDPIGITLGDEDIQICRSKGFEVYKMDQSFTDFDQETFDLIWARHVLEHSIMPLFTLAEYYRIAKNNSFIYIEVPGSDTDARHETNPNHYSIFPRSSWRSLITKSGFTVIEEFQTKLELKNGGKDEYYGFLCKKVAQLNKNNKLFLGLSSGENFGWGVCSKYLKKELSKRLEIVNLDEATETKSKGFVDGSIFHALTADFETLFPVRGSRNFGYTFFEYELSETALKNASKYDLIFTGSTWNKQKLKQKGIDNTAVLIQGIDPALFYYEEKLKSNDLFVIFSGGKFELRKGQDLVLKAFKILSQKYPDIILINAWYNMWPETLKSMYQSKHIKFEYTGETWKNFMINLCKINDIDGNKVFTLPITPNEKLREIYQNSDVGLFPNRCEGGTNLVLMEYMACGKPVIASYNTGHKDILNQYNSLSLMKMNEYKLFNENRLLADWTEPDIDEIIAKLEFAYNNRSEIKNIGKLASDFMKNFTWSHSAESLIQKIM